MEPVDLGSALAIFVVVWGWIDQRIVHVGVEELIGTRDRMITLKRVG